MNQTFKVPLRSARLVLRRLQPGDAGALCAYRSLPEVARCQSWESFGPEDAARLIGAQAGAEPNIPGTWLQLAIIKTDSGQLIGDCGLHCRKENPRKMEIGITLAPEHQGQGHATETVVCLLDYVFGSLGADQVIATTDAENVPAAALFRRIGFRQESQWPEKVWFKGRWGGEYIFEISAREWADRPLQTAAGRRHDGPNRLR
jgi:RimJ/RimL family protein N-acetyltransferase